MGLDPRGGRLQSVIEWAVAEGMPAGIAVKCHLQHATPAAFYAHVPDRGDEKAITRDLLASNIDVLIGAGRRLEKESSEGGSYRDAFGRRGYAVAGSLEEAEPCKDKVFILNHQKKIELFLKLFCFIYVIQIILSVLNLPLLLSGCKSS